MIVYTSNVADYTHSSTDCVDWNHDLDGTGVTITATTSASSNTIIISKPSKQVVKESQAIKESPVLVARYWRLPIDQIISVNQPIKPRVWARRSCGYPREGQGCRNYAKR